MDGLALALVLVLFALLFSLFVVMGVAIWVLSKRRRTEQRTRAANAQPPDSQEAPDAPPSISPDGS
ncbi:MAG: hypothetical protein WBG36_04700 [Ornithinimicrobium sp.]